MFTSIFAEAFYAVWWSRDRRLDHAASRRISEIQKEHIKILEKHIVFLRGEVESKDRIVRKSQIAISGLEGQVKRTESLSSGLKRQLKVSVDALMTLKRVHQIERKAFEEERKAWSQSKR